MRNYIFLFLISIRYSLLNSTTAFAQNPLFIPDTLSGTVFNLKIEKGITQFFPGKNTTTFGYNGALLGPTLFMNKGDFITLHVTNTLTTPTTTHWHGLHVPAKYDGGPHQIIQTNTTWNPTFKILNNAATYWYHPHGAGKTEIQVSKGLAGLLIIRDSAEASYNLPRKYNVDDFPLIIQSKAFDVFNQIATASHEDSVPMVNGTINPFLKVPKQIVRFRLLNGSTDRTYLLGLSDNANFFVIASDGGMLSQPYSTNRLRLSVGERAEILIDFGSNSIGQQKYLKSYASELPKGIIGSDSVGTSTILIQEGYYSNLLNGHDFNLLRFDVIAPTTNSITNIPSKFKPISRTSASSATVTRNIHFSPDTVTSGIQGYVDGPFRINNQTFNMDSINQLIYLNDIEIWKLTNETMVAHPFHIHDVQFFILDINGTPPSPEYAGFKDVVLVKPTDTVRFITKFDDFADDSIPYMFHCHLLHHEDEGMMGEFLVVDTTLSSISKIDIANTITVFPNPNSGKIQIQSFKYKINSVAIFNMLGEKTGSSSKSGYSLITDVDVLTNGIYFLNINTTKGIITKEIIIHK